VKGNVAATEARQSNVPAFIAAVRSASALLKSIMAAISAPPTTTLATANSLSPGPRAQKEQEQGKP
jgi:hypothetical protein